jgi:ASC-1-like (ASCH) protein
MITLPLRQIYFNAIRAGQKAFEGRLYRPNLHQLIPGTEICFKCEETQDQLIKRVAWIRTYKTFRDMLEQEGVTNCLPGVTKVDDGVGLYLSFPNYKTLEQVHGVVAIGLDHGPSSQ